MNTYEITCDYMNESFSVELNTFTKTEDDVLEILKDLKKERFEQESGEDFTEEPEEDFTVEDWQEVPEELQDFDILEYFLEDDDHDEDVWVAGIKAGIEPENIEEAYSGHWSSDADFAQDMAEQTGAIDKNAGWPLLCIDWEWAARELMYDYSEANGHYFRNF